MKKIYQCNEADERVGGTQEVEDAKLQGSGSKREETVEKRECHRSAILYHIHVARERERERERENRTKQRRQKKKKSRSKGST